MTPPISRNDDDLVDASEHTPYRAKVFTKDAWLRRLANVNVFEGDLQAVIMNYFTVRGNPKAAEAFAKETDTKPEMPLHCIYLRAQIRQAVLAGDIEDAINYVNQINPTILEQNPELSFRLKQQQLQQLVEKGDTNAVIEFAQQRLAPCVKMHPELLPELEKSMSLLFFNDLSSKTAQRLSGGIGQREAAANRIDDVILKFYNIEKESVIEMMVKNLIWTQRQIQEASCRFLEETTAGKGYSRTADVEPETTALQCETLNKLVAAWPSARYPFKVLVDQPSSAVPPSLCPLLVDISTGSMSSAFVPSSLSSWEHGSKKSSATARHHDHHRGGSPAVSARAAISERQQSLSASSSSGGSMSSSSSTRRGAFPSDAGLSSPPLLSLSNTASRVNVSRALTAGVHPMATAAATASSSSPTYPTPSWGLGSLPQGLIMIQGSPTVSSSTASTTTSSSAATSSGSRSS